MKTITQTYHIHAAPKLVWQALVNPKHINAWGGGPAKMSPKVGATFTLWGGDFHGVNIEVIANKRLVQAWYERDWEEPSIAIFSLTAETTGTKLVFTQRNVPVASLKDINEGWKEYYLGPLKHYVEQI